MLICLLACVFENEYALVGNTYAPSGKTVTPQVSTPMLTTGNCIFTRIIFLPCRLRGRAYRRGRWLRKPQLASPLRASLELHVARASPSTQGGCEARAPGICREGKYIWTAAWEGVLIWMFVTKKEIQEWTDNDYISGKIFDTHSAHCVLSLKKYVYFRWDENISWIMV